MIRQIQYFQAIVKYQSFTKAAEELFISQSAISQQIKSLEEELGVQLLIGKNRSFELSEAGAYFYRQSQKLLQSFEQNKEKTRQQRCYCGFWKKEGENRLYQHLTDLIKAQ